MIIYFDGPDQTRKTTTIHAVSQATGIPVWERGPFLPHHHGRDFNTEDSIWYVLDDMKTIDLLRKIGATVLVDRHPVISEIVYRGKQGQISPLSTWMAPDDEVIIFLPTEDDSTLWLYKKVCDRSGIRYQAIEEVERMSLLSVVVSRVMKLSRENDHA